MSVPQEPAAGGLDGDQRLRAELAVEVCAATCPPGHAVGGRCAAGWAAAGRLLGSQAVRRLRDTVREQALRDAAAEIEAELICCPDDAVNPRHAICRWSIASRNLVLSQAPDGARPTRR